MDINIFWEGPLKREDVKKLKGPKDYGVYQVYGIHPSYGRGVLLYIGQAASQNFSQRLEQHEWVRDGYITDEVTVYVGRLAGWRKPNGDVWDEMIDKAEALLITAHQPAYNTQRKNSINESCLADVHVINWNSYNRLFPEVSSKRFTSKFDHITDERIFCDDLD